MHYWCHKWLTLRKSINVHFIWKKCAQEILPPSLPIIKYLSKSKPKNAWHSYILRCYVIWCVLCIDLVVHTLQQYRGSLNSPKSKRQFQYWVVSFWSQNNQYYIVKLVRLLAKVWFSALTIFKQHTNSAIQSQYTRFGSTIRGPPIVVSNSP